MNGVRAQRRPVGWRRSGESASDAIRRSWGARRPAAWRYLRADAHRLHMSVSTASGSQPAANAGGAGLSHCPQSPTNEGEPRTLKRLNIFPVIAVPRNAWICAPKTPMRSMIENHAPVCSCGIFPRTSVIFVICAYIALYLFFSSSINNGASS